MTVAYAISRADLVVIPAQGSQLDAAEAAKAIRAAGRIPPTQEGFAAAMAVDMTLLLRTSLDDAARRPHAHPHNHNNSTLLSGLLSLHQLEVSEV